MREEEITDEYMRERLAQTRTYTLVLISRGPRYDSPDRDSTVWRHGRRNFALRENDGLAIVCPVRDDTDLCGLYIFDRDREAVTTIMENDPGVMSGVFVFEVYAIVGFPGDSLPKAL